MEEALESAEPRRRTEALPYILTFLYTTVFWWLLLSFQTDQTTETTRTEILHCGNSTSEARSLGCLYDPLTALWMPEPCIDWDAIEAYKRAVNWHGYRDTQGSERLSIEEMSEIVEPAFYYTTAREHVVHCALMWQKQHKGFAQGGLYMDDSSLNYRHTLHCSMVLMKFAEQDPKHLERFITENTAGFSRCLVEK